MRTQTHIKENFKLASEWSRVYKWGSIQYHLHHLLQTVFSERYKRRPLTHSHDLIGFGAICGQRDLLAVWCSNITAMESQDNCCRWEDIRLWCSTFHNTRYLCRNPFISPLCMPSKRHSPEERCWYILLLYPTTLTVDGAYTGIPYSSLIVGAPRETHANERRVSLTPQNVASLKKKGFSSVFVERDAGVGARFLDEEYAKAGATLVSKNELFSKTDILLKVRPPLQDDEITRLKEGSTIISFLYPSQNKSLVEALASRKLNAFAMDMIPRISRAQTFDALR